MATSNSESADEQYIEVDVVDGSVEDPLWLLASRKFVTLAVECVMEQEDESDATEEEEVDVTGEDTEWYLCSCWEYMFSILNSWADVWTKFLTQGLIYQMVRRIPAFFCQFDIVYVS